MPTLRQTRLATLAAHPSSPLITDRTQGRVELSHATFDNWVTKTVNFLHLDCDVEPGSSISIDLPLHWMTAVWVVSAWEAGAEVIIGGSGDLSISTSDGADVLVVADPLGMAPVPAGTHAPWFFPADVRGMPDQLMLPPADPGGLAGGTAEQVFARAVEYAQAVDLRPGGRLVTDLEPSSEAAVLAAIAAPIAVGAGVVYGPADGESPTTRAV